MKKILLALASLSLLTAFAAEAADPKVSHPFSSTRERGTVRRVVIELPAGSVVVRNGAAGSISVSGVASREYQGSREKAWSQKVVNASSADIYASGDEAIVRRRFGKDADSFRAQKFTSFELIVEVPPGMDVDVQTSYGEVKMAGVFGRVSSDLKAGEIHFESPRAMVKELNASCRVGEVHANLGDETVTKEGLLPGRTHFYNASGNSIVDLHVTAGEVHVQLLR